MIFIIRYEAAGSRQ